LLSQVEVWLTVRKILQDGIEIEQLDMANFGGAINTLVAFISRSKDELVMPDAIRDYIQAIPEDDAEHAAEMRDYLRVYTAYRDRCLERGAIDYGDQIQLAVHALDNDGELLAEYRDRYRFFVVDEYQDTNFAQAELVRRLAAPGYDLRVVGDPQQSIYRFRGAAVDNIRRFSDEIPGTTDVKLSTNFRSHQAILDVANRLVSRHRHGSNA
jgi:DNA helicase II / ATP-dependent DNA helicase PcrA